MTEDAPAIEATDLTKAFAGKVVVNRVSLQVAKGEIFGFLGPNGSGKTTFIRMLCGLLTPDGGSGRCLGYDIVAEADRIRPHVGYMAQHFSLYEDLSVRENLDFMARIYQVEGRAKVVAQTLERMGLERFAGQLAGTLSGGWKQRLALGACLLHEPRVLLLDEPTAGVDPKARRDFWDDVYALSAEGITALISTHYMDEAERCHRLAYLAYGDLLTAGTAEEVIEREGLVTWSVSGKKMHALAQQLKEREGVEQVVPFGNTLHVSGHDGEKLQEAIAPFRDERYRWERSAANLEETFISLMRNDRREVER